jgi:hypothetical protein
MTMSNDSARRARAAWILSGLLGLAALGLTFLWPSWATLWGIGLVAAVVGLAWWGDVPWLRDDLPPDALAVEPPANARRTALLLVGIALAFQLGRWLAEGGALRTRLGDDDETYVFLAYQILGVFGAPPVFALRAPGWPLIISGLVSLFGRREIWVVALYHRVLLAAFPPLLYLIMRRFLRQPIAILAALLSLTMEYNETIATAAMTDLTYLAGGLIGLYAIIQALTGRRPVRWLLIAGLVFALRSTVRVSGLPVAVASAAAFIVISRAPLARRFGGALLLVGPTVAALLGISAYNQATSGHFAFSSELGLSFLSQYPPYLSETPDTPTMHEAAALLPEVPPEKLFSSSGDAWLVQYRLTASGMGDPFDYGALSARIMREIVWARPGEVAVRALEGVAVMLTDPLRSFLPRSWYLWPGQLDPSREREVVITENLPACNIQTAFGAIVKTEWCDEYDQLRADLNFAPPWLAGMPGFLQRGLRLLTVSLPYRIRLATWPLYWGIAGFAGMIYLFTRPETRSLVILLALPLLVEFGLVIVATTGTDTRFLLYFHPTYLIVTWLGLGFIIRKLAVLRGTQ